MIVHLYCMLCNVECCNQYFNYSATQKVKEPKVHVAWAQGSRSRREAVMEEVMDSYTHFSTFALSGTNGTMRWHHLPADFKPHQVRTALFYFKFCHIRILYYSISQ